LRRGYGWREDTIKRALSRIQTNYSVELSVCSRSVTNLRKQTHTQSGNVVKYQLVILGFMTVAQDSCWYLATNWIIAFAYSQITYWLVHAIAVGAGTTFLHFITYEFLFLPPLLMTLTFGNLKKRTLMLHFLLYMTISSASILIAYFCSIESLLRYFVISQLIT